MTITRRRRRDTEPNWLGLLRPRSRTDKDAFILVCVGRMSPGAEREEVKDLLEWDDTRLNEAADAGRVVLRQMGWSG